MGSGAWEASDDRRCFHLALPVSLPASLPLRRLPRRGAGPHVVRTHGACGAVPRWETEASGPWPALTRRADP